MESGILPHSSAFICKGEWRDIFPPMEWQDCNQGSIGFLSTEFIQIVQRIHSKILKVTVREGETFYILKQLLASVLFSEDG